MGHVNIEIKARCTQQEKVRDILHAQHAIYKGTDHQIDTYFKVPHGRLKLREGNIENSLIYYDRENTEGPKQSHIILYQSQPESTLKDILLNACGPLVVVDKQREIYFIENVKFHLDQVERLGTFVEIEAIDVDGTIGKETLLAQCTSYMHLFDIAPSDLISMSYSDLFLI